MARYSGWQPGRPDHLRIRQAKLMFKLALKYGVTIACGSDVGVFAHGDNAREIELMSEYGMGPIRALQAATTVAAKVLQRDHELGRLTPGYLADIVILAANPHETPTALRKVRHVIKNGTLITKEF
jgi:imidazolonepropionase-like amidohydrolase